jgi:hypothetical protein
MYNAQKYETATIRETKQTLQKLSPNEKTNKLILQDLEKTT